jgi:hypothetical protein
LCTSPAPYGLGLSEEHFWDLSLAEFKALHKQYRDWRDFHMLGHQFTATVAARLAGDKDANFMPDAPEKKLLSLDVTEATFRALAQQRGTLITSGI